MYIYIYIYIYLAFTSETEFAPAGTATPYSTFVVGPLFSFAVCSPSFGSIFGSIVGPFWSPFWAPNLLQNLLKQWSFFGPIVEPFFRNVGPHFGVQNLPK
jgi:hypothetical protein